MRSRSAARSAARQPMVRPRSVSQRTVEQQTVELVEVGASTTCAASCTLPSACKRRPASREARLTGPHGQFQHRPRMSSRGDVRNELRPPTRRRAHGPRPGAARTAASSGSFVELLGGTEQRRQLQCRNLGQGGPVDVVGADCAPHVQIQAGVDGGSASGPRARTSSTKRATPPGPAVPDGAGHRAQHRGRLDRCR